MQVTQEDLEKAVAFSKLFSESKIEIKMKDLVPSAQSLIFYAQLVKRIDEDIKTQEALKNMKVVDNPIVEEQTEKPTKKGK